MYGEYEYLVNGVIKGSAFNDDVILLSQIPRDSLLECNVNSGKYSIEACADIIKNGVFRQYWIIRKHNKQVIRPLKKNEFVAAVKEMKLNQQLYKDVLKR